MNKRKGKVEEIFIFLKSMSTPLLLFNIFC